ncbi:centaurin-gamma-1A-like isoform X2 [Dermacentor andersoni]|uniref:centaurin-gamma-1A-like isoform X2 n=1 Tax=Dermacentor andersoni TaxID=34620 RepID=UPI0021553D17|nr:centaurin-gamma-1A-like isoform X2 [Dermacentor andersoni]
MEKFFLRALGRSYTYCCAEATPPLPAPPPPQQQPPPSGRTSGGGRRSADVGGPAVLRSKASSRHQHARSSPRKRHSFVNSQEWTLSRSVPDIRLGIVGSLTSGKSALVHRYLTGSYMQDESPEGGRFKKEIVVDGHSYLLLIRDEGGPPELQFSCWVDAVIFVFSLENEASFSAVYSYYMRMAHFRNNAADLPLILVGTQDAISESNPRVIDDSRARKLASDLKRCTYYETCATYGFNVERVFQDACQRIVQMRMASALTPNNSRPSTPVGVGAGRATAHFGIASNGYAREQQPQSAVPTSNATATLVNSYNALHGGAVNTPTTNINQTSLKESHLRQIRDCITAGTSVQREIQKFEKSGTPTTAPLQASEAMPPPSAASGNNRDRPEFVTPCSTPTTARKTRRRSNLFTPLKKADEEKRLRNGEMGSGRVIPVRQGYLYKKSLKALNKEWKKKYVTLTSDGRLTYHPSLHDYMDDVHGKEIPLMHTTVKIPGQKPRGSRAAGSTPQVNDLASDVGTLSLAGGIPYFKYKEPRERDCLASFDPSADAQHSNAFFSGMLNGSETQLIPAVPNTNPMLSKLETPNVKKRHRRMKSTGAKNFEAMEDSDGYEFIIVSLDNKQWQFEASNGDDREGWVSAIEQQILSSLQGNESSKAKSRMNSIVDSATSIQAIRTTVPGNSHCADCDTQQPDWASLNLGTLICIECSGIHRNLGSHISRVRSLDLDDWPPEHVAVMMALGNMASNSIWEGNAARSGYAKPGPHSSRDEKERWIRAKYEQREFLAPLPSSSGPTAQQLRDAVCRGDVRQVALLLAHAAPHQHELVNAPTSARDSRTPLHMAAALGKLAMVQLLLWNNANAKAVDSEGRTPLVYAKNSNFTEIYELLLHSGGPDPNQLSTTLSRRRGSLSKRSDVFDKLPASII